MNSPYSYLPYICPVKHRFRENSGGIFTLLKIKKASAKGLLGSCFTKTKQINDVRSISNSLHLIPPKQQEVRAESREHPGGLSPFSFVNIVN